MLTRRTSRTGQTHGTANYRTNTVLSVTVKPLRRDLHPALGLGIGFRNCQRGVNGGVSTLTLSQFPLRTAINSGLSTPYVNRRATPWTTPGGYPGVYPSLYNLFPGFGPVFCCEARSSRGRSLPGWGRRWGRSPDNHWRCSHEASKPTSLGGDRLPATASRVGNWLAPHPVPG